MPLETRRRRTHMPLIGALVVTGPELPNVLSKLDSLKSLLRPDCRLTDLESHR